MQPDKPVKTSKRGKYNVTDIDRYVGEKMRLRMRLLGITQEQMAYQLRITYQQVSKYQKGINRIAAGRLYEISHVLNVDINYFFEGLDSGGKGKLTPEQRIQVELAKNFKNISRPAHRRALADITAALTE